MKINTATLEPGKIIKKKEKALISTPTMKDTKGIGSRIKSMAKGSIATKMGILIMDNGDRTIAMEMEPWNIIMVHFIEEPGKRENSKEEDFLTLETEILMMGSG